MCVSERVSVYCAMVEINFSTVDASIWIEFSLPEMQYLQLENTI